MRSNVEDQGQMSKIKVIHDLSRRESRQDNIGLQWKITWS